MKYLWFILLTFSVISCTSNIVKIDNYDNPKKALLVIDMQIDYIGENARYSVENSQIDNLIGITNEIIEYSNQNNFSIIYLRRIFRENDWHNIFNNHAAIEGTIGVEIDPRINIVSENIFDKYTASAFSNKDFKNYLIQNQINELYLCGVMADQCVYETALDAFNEGYIVSYYANAVGSTSIKKIENAVRKLGNRGINIVKWQEINMT
jgi:nicotinamidase-related amidase